MFMNQRMTEVLTRASDVLKQQDREAIQKERALELALRTWICTKCDVELPDEVAISAEFEPIDRTNLNVQFKLIPNPATPLFYVRMASPARVVKGRLEIDLDNLIWYGYHSAHRRTFTDFEQAVRFALTGQK